MLSRYFVGKPQFNSNINITFLGQKKVSSNPSGSESYVENPNYNQYLKRKGELGDLSNVSFFVRKYVNEQAYKQGVSNDEYLRGLIKSPIYAPLVTPVDSKTVKIGDTKVTTLIDGDQIFAKTKEYLRSAQKTIQLEMFEFQNLTVDGKIWPASGADRTQGGRDQQELLLILLNKKKENPDMKIQIILDAHKWYIDGIGGYKRHYNNADMIRFLKEKGIDVVPYPRAVQGGSTLQHVKMLAIDGKKVLLGGMNWGNHSAANHDACVAIETQDKKDSSEVDNIINQTFTPDWNLSWYQLGRTPLISGPLNEEEQKHFNRLRKEIKEENVQYMRIVGELFDNPENRNRYNEARLDIIETKPIENPQIHILGTKPKELEEVGYKGVESTKDYIMDKLNACKKLRAELFVISDKEVINTIIKRVKTGEMDAQILIHHEMFHYCRTSYNKLVENGVDVRIYKGDERINQRMHSKWAVFDDKDILIGSTNWSAQGLTQNLKKGFRDDYDLVDEEIDEQIEKFKDQVAKFEDEIDLPNTTGDYEQIKHRKLRLGHAIKQLNKEDSAEIEIDGKNYSFTKEQKATLTKIKGYYGNIAYRNNSRQKYKRGNNELGTAFESSMLAKSVFIKQFNRDWKASEDESDKLDNDVMPMILAGERLNIAG